MTQVARIPKFNLSAIIDSSNPQIDLKLEAYETSTRNFLKAVSNYTQRALAEITDRKNAQVVATKQLAEKMQHIEVETNQCKVKELALIGALEKELQEKREAETSVAAFRRQLASIKERCSSLDVEMEQHRAVTGNMRRERNREQTVLQSHAAHIAPELLDCENKLQCLVEGIDRDKILVRFPHLDNTDFSHDFSLVIDVSNRSYKVPTTTPFIPTLPILLDGLNQSRDVYAFIKQVRLAFSNLVHQNGSDK